jgi:thiamine biosynthesis lipoprotein ApbE
MILWMHLTWAGEQVLVRNSQQAMGTLVGITVVADSEDQESAYHSIDGAFKEIERWEAMASEWRPTSLSGRINAGEKLEVPEELDALFSFSLWLQEESMGAFSLTWKGGVFEKKEGRWGVEEGKLDLGGILKGFLNDRAAEFLNKAGYQHFLIDAAGDILAAGHPPGRWGWPVGLADLEAMQGQVVLQNAALSTSGQRWQPGHIQDASGQNRQQDIQLVSVITKGDAAGMVADALATASFAAGRPVAGPAGTRSWICMVANNQPTGGGFRFKWAHLTTIDY